MYSFGQFRDSSRNSLRNPYTQPLFGYPVTSRAWVGALGESGAAAVLEHNFLQGFQAFARVDVTDVGRPTFSQSTCPRPTDGFCVEVN